MTRRLVVMGVAGSGKTTVGRLVADRLGARFVDADAVHPAANIEKMAAGIPLTDVDRRPWLRRLRDALAESHDIVVACSALKRRYRDELRAAGEVGFVFLDVDESTAVARTAERTDHFMQPGMVRSQFEALERPAADELDVVTIVVDADETSGSVTETALALVVGAGRCGR